MDHVSSCIALPFFTEDALIALEPTEIENKTLFFLHIAPHQCAFFTVGALTSRHSVSTPHKECPSVAQEKQENCC